MATYAIRKTGSVLALEWGRSSSEPNRFHNLDRSFPIESVKRGLVRPVVAVNEEHVIARAHDPAETRLPSQLTRDRVELDPVHERDERIELGIDVGQPHPSREAAFFKSDVVVVCSDIHEPAAMGTDT